MIHHIEPNVSNLHGNFSREMPPILTIDPGDSVIAGTRFCDWDAGEPPCAPGVPPAAIPPSERRDPENDVGLCLVGPIEVIGSRPGMTLEVQLEELQVGAYGLTLIGDGAARRTGIEAGGPACLTWTLDSRTGAALASNGFAVPVRPFLGCIGLAPDLPGHVSNTVPRRTGINMDCKELIVGTKLYLPVEVAGAMLSFGDGHAAQGDGEMAGYAIECPMDKVKLTVRLCDEPKVKWPIARLPEGWLALGFDDELEGAMRIAIDGMLDIMTRELGISRVEAYMLAGAAVDLRITQVANPAVGVHAVWRDGAIITPRV